jgi:hypothetical protein
MKKNIFFTVILSFYCLANFSYAISKPIDFTKLIQKACCYEHDEDHNYTFDIINNDINNFGFGLFDSIILSSK